MENGNKTATEFCKTMIFKVKQYKRKDGQNPDKHGILSIFCNSVILRKTSVLFGVQFDDVGFVDFVFVGEFVSLGETGQGCGPVVEGLLM